MRPIILTDTQREVYNAMDNHEMTISKIRSNLTFCVSIYNCLRTLEKIEAVIKTRQFQMVGAEFITWRKNPKVKVI